MCGSIDWLLVLGDRSQAERAMSDLYPTEGLPLLSEADSCCVHIEADSESIRGRPPVFSEEVPARLPAIPTPGGYERGVAPKTSSTACSRSLRSSTFARPTPERS